MSFDIFDIFIIASCVFFFMWVFRVRIVFPAQFADMAAYAESVARELRTASSSAVHEQTTLNKHIEDGIKRFNDAIAAANKRMDRAYTQLGDTGLTIEMLNKLKVEVAAKIRLSEQADVPGAVCGIGLDPHLCGELIKLAEEALINRRNVTERG